MLRVNRTKFIYKFDISKKRNEEKGRKGKGREGDGREGEGKGKGRKEKGKQGIRYRMYFTTLNFRREGRACVLIEVGKKPRSLKF